MQTRSLGGRTVGAIGLGAMPMSLAGRPDEARSLRTIHAALDAGVTLIDTADAYCVSADDVGHNERLVARALRAGDLVRRPRGDQGDLATNGAAGVDGRPGHLKAACEASEGASRPSACTSSIAQVPYAESVGALAERRARSSWPG